MNKLIMCARLDSNQGPPRYKLGALPTELRALIRIPLSLDSKLNALPTELGTGTETISLLQGKNKKLPEGGELFGHTGRLHAACSGSGHTLLLHAEADVENEDRKDNME